MSIVTYTTEGKTQIDKLSAFCEILQNRLPDRDCLFVDLLEGFDSAIRNAHPEVSGGALNNCHGDWYEWLLAIEAWNYHARHQDSLIMVLLPNVRQFDVMRLYNDELYGLVLDLRQKVEEISTVRLITSNPDFVLIDPSNININGLDIDFSEIFDRVDIPVIRKIEQLHQHFINTGDFNTIVGFLAVKTSFRPDRRLQISHEGSLMKALYTHIQTRKWVISPKGLKYYAAATTVGQEDRNALKTVATHSITTVHNIPQAAVDDVFEINSLNQAEHVYGLILH